MESVKEHWDIEIKPRGSNFSLNLKEICKYRDLIGMYIRRNIVTAYKQTILGPLWYVIQPLFTTIMYMFLFGGIAQISTEDLPQPVFYFSGIMLWNYFSECLGNAQGTFSGNAAVFSKVYFPRMVVPISASISTLVKLGIQLVTFAVIYLYFYIDGADMRPNIYLLLFPVLIVMTAFMGMGFGIIISSLTTKYRDLAILFGFITSLWMYATPIAYPLSAIPEKYANYKWIIELNPMSSVIETTRYIFTGAGSLSWEGLIYSFVITIILVIFGTWMFNKVERSFIDVV